MLLYIAQRLYMGAGQYGPLDVATDPRDWREEARQEFADGAVYLAIAGLRATTGPRCSTLCHPSEPCSLAQDGRCVERLRP